MNNSRHEGIFSPADHKDKWIHIIGLGNIGSHVATALARMGFEKFVLYDFDEIEDVNLATQNFDLADERPEKIEAMSEKILNINPEIEVICENTKLDEDSTEFEHSPGQPLCIISGVDSMEVRSVIKDLLLASIDYLNVPVIDGRLGKEQVEVLFSKNAEDWDLDVDADTLADVGCTEKYISYTPLMVAALISSTVKKMCNEENIPKEVIFEFASNHYLTIK